MKSFILCCFIALAFSCSASAQLRISAKDAGSHIGDSVTVIAQVFGGKLFPSNNMILLDLGGKHPDQQLTVMIPGTCKANFTDKPESDYTGKTVTVAGKIIDYKGKPEIVVCDPSQLKIVMMDNVRQKPMRK